MIEGISAMSFSLGALQWRIEPFEDTSENGFRLDEEIVKQQVAYETLHGPFTMRGPIWAHDLQYWRGAPPMADLLKEHQLLASRLTIPYLDASIALPAIPLRGGSGLQKERMMLRRYAEEIILKPMVHYPTH